MKLVTDKHGREYLIEHILINKIQVVALVDTGATLLVLSQKLIKKAHLDVVKGKDLHGMGFKTKSDTGYAIVTINNRSGEQEFCTLDFTALHKEAKKVGSPIFDVILSMREIRKFKLRKKIYQCLR